MTWPFRKAGTSRKRIMSPAGRMHHDIRGVLCAMVFRPARRWLDHRAVAARVCRRNYSWLASGYSARLERQVATHFDGLVCETGAGHRSEEHTSELQSLMRISYAVFCLKKKKHIEHITN